MIPAAFDYARATSVDDALAQVAGGAKVIAGGQSLIGLLKLRLAQPEKLVDIGGLRELRANRELPDGGYEIGATAILYGADSNPTPLGQHVITQKKVHHISNLYGAPMPYMMRLTNDGVAIHASDIKQGLATHGCIGVPLPFARLLFAQAKLGDRVIITRGKRLGLGGAITG